MKRFHVERFEANWFRLFVGALGAAIVMIAGTARAQYTADYQTNIISGVTSNWADYYYIGYAADVLLIRNAGVLSCDYVFLGNNSGSSNNSVLVSDSGSAWSNGVVYVGSEGSGNSLVISNGGGVFSFGSTIGWGYPTGGNSNSVLVTGSGSVWNNRYGLGVGAYGSGNSLVINNGGTVFNSSSMIGYWASNNSVLVTDSGSVWSNRSTLEVGYFGNGTSLVISNGGRVFNSSSYIGESSTNNSVLVTGSGSVWNNQGGIYVGCNVYNEYYSGTGNSLAINNGGTVVSSNLYVGCNPSSTNNLVTLNGGNLIVARGSGNGVLDVRRGTLTLNSGTVSVDRLAATNIGSVVTFNGGMLNTKGTTVNNGSPFTVGNGSGAATLNLQGGTHSFANGLVISSNAVLKGTGTIYANLTLAGTLAPGNSPGAITNFGNLSLQSSAVLQFELGGTVQGSGYDFILVTNGVATLDGLLQVGFINGFQTNVLSSDTFTLLTADTLTGSFTNVLSGERLMTIGGEGSFLVDYYSGGSLVLRGYQVIPEPGTWALCTLGLVGLFLGGRWRARQRGRFSG